MPVDPTKPREILVVHGIETGTDADLHQHEEVGKLVQAHLNGVPVSFTTDLYRYENINDDAQAKLKKVLSIVGKALLNQVSIGGMLVDAGERAIDLIGDVVIALENGSTASHIRAGLRQRIMQTYATTGAPLYIVAHSLGSVYALDVVAELIRERPDGIFQRDSRRTWPVQGIITLGSPLGLGMFSHGRALPDLGPGRKWLRWFNYWGRTDPVVSGSFYGDPVDGYQIAERYLKGHATEGWVVQDRVVDSGEAWLGAHLSYWSYPPLGDDLVTFISS